MELDMAICIRTELDRINEIINAIQAMAGTSIDQAYPDSQPPHWSITLDLLAKLASTEMEELHNRLTIAAITEIIHDEKYESR
jgi:hypothetical protein